jgi:hypothetical protein
VLRKGDLEVTKAIEGVTDPEEKLERAIGAGIEHIIKQQVHVGLFLHEFDSLSGKRQKNVQDAMTNYQRRFVQIMREGQAAGKFVEGDTWLLLNGILGVINWIYRWYPGPKNPSLDEVKKTFISFIMNGIKRR